MTEGSRLCRACGLEHPLDEFRKRGPSAGAREGQPYGRCSECQRAYDSERFNSTDPIPFLIQLSHHRKRFSKHEWQITPSDIAGLWFSQGGLCAITGRNMTTERGEGTVYTNASIDRIDSSIGYRKDNIHLVCNIVNLMKNTLSVAQLHDWCEAVLAHRDDPLKHQK